MKRVLILAAAIGLVTACSKSEVQKTEEKPQSTETKASQPEPKEAKVRLAPLSPEIPRSRSPDLATAEDFEQEAGKVVALENLEAELDRLEAEIESIPN